MDLSVLPTELKYEIFSYIETYPYIKELSDYYYNPVVWEQDEYGNLIGNNLLKELDIFIGRKMKYGFGVGLWRCYGIDVYIHDYERYI